MWSNKLIHLFSLAHALWLAWRFCSQFLLSAPWIPRSHLHGVTWMECKMRCNRPLIILPPPSLSSTFCSRHILHAWIWWNDWSDLWNVLFNIYNCSDSGPSSACSSWVPRMVLPHSSKSVHFHHKSTLSKRNFDFIYLSWWIADSWQSLNLVMKIVWSIMMDTIERKTMRKKYTYTEGHHYSYHWLFTHSI